MANTSIVPPSTTPASPRWPVVHHPAAAYGAALVLTLLAWWVRASLDGLLGNSNRMVFFIIAATFSAFLFGRGPGIASTLLGCALGTYFFVQPRYSFQIANVQHGLSIVAVALQGILTSLCAGYLHRALRIRRE